MRYYLAFFLCCCKSFLGEEQERKDDFYSLLGVDRDASPEEIKKAYKRKSLQMHPDKLAQKGLSVTEESQALFTRMKEAYEVLSDPRKRETYDAIGERGMKWIEEPFSLDPQELAHNFATSSVLDRSKVFGIFVAIAVAVFLLPFCICLMVDGAFGPHAKWMAVLFPLWIWDAGILFYHSHIIMMGPIARPEHIPPEEWVDPLPMKKRIFSLVRFALIVLFEILGALKLDHVIAWPWFVVFFPLYIWEATTIYKKFPLAKMRIVTIEDLEVALGKPFSQFTPSEKELIGKRYSVVPSTTSPEFEAAQKLKLRARHDLIKSAFRIGFCFLVLIQLDGAVDWNWWFVFAPLWIMAILFCYSNYTSFVEVQQMAAEKDPATFGYKKDMDHAKDDQANYGALGTDGTASSTAASKPELTEEEREELKAQVMASNSRLCTKCCSQGFLLIIAVLLVAKMQGADFSAFWIISPFLFVAGTILCCVGCAIFGITEVSTDGVTFDASDIDVEAGKTPFGNPVAHYVPPSVPSTENESQQNPVVSMQDAAPGGHPSTVANTNISEADATSMPSSKQSNNLGSASQGQIQSATSDELHGLD